MKTPLEKEGFEEAMREVVIALNLCRDLMRVEAGITKSHRWDAAIARCDAALAALKGGEAK